MFRRVNRAAPYPARTMIDDASAAFYGGDSNGFKAGPKRHRSARAGRVPYACGQAAFVHAPPVRTDGETPPGERSAGVVRKEFREVVRFPMRPALWFARAAALATPDSADSRTLQYR
jgi:hypothetical protein